MYNGARNSQHTGFPGWETEAEEALLLEQASKVPAQGVLVEIGAEFGMSTAALLSQKPQTARLYSVDKMTDELWNDLEQRIQLAGLSENWVQCRGLSEDWARQITDPIDLLFIDGDHSYAGALADAQLWTPKLAVGGRVIFHDVASPTNRNPHPLHYEVAQAVQEWFEAATDVMLLKHVDSMAVYKRID